VLQMFRELSHAFPYLLLCRSIGGWYVRFSDTSVLKLFVFCVGNIIISSTVQCRYQHSGRLWPCCAFFISTDEIWYWL